MRQDLLDQRMRKTLVDLSVISHAPAATLQPSTSHTKPGTIEPAGDTTPAQFKQQYLEARAFGSLRERLMIIERCEAEVRSLRHRTIIHVKGETEVERRKRIVKETADWKPEDVQQSRHGILASTIRKWRKIEGVDPETGMPRTTKLDAPARRQEAWRLHTENPGLSLREIGRLLGGEHPQTVSRDLAAVRQRAA